MSGDNTTMPLDLGNVEYWVVRVALHKGRKHARQPDLLIGVTEEGIEGCAYVEDGFILLPDGNIAETIEMHAEEPAAHEHRERLRKQYPGEDFRVIMNAGGAP